MIKDVIDDDEEGSFDDSEGNITKRIILHVYDDESKEFTSLTTYHGMIRIYSSETWPSRIFWSLVVVTCLTLFMIHSGLMLLFYHSHPTFIESMDTHLTFDYLPAITICWLQENYQEEVYNNISSYLIDNPITTGMLADLEKLDSSTIMKDYLEDTAPQCSEFIKEVRIRGQKITDICGLVKHTLTEYGYCSTISGWRAAIQNFVPSDPLEIDLNRSPGDTVIYQLRSSNASSTIRSAGIHLKRGVKHGIHVVPRKQTFLEASDWGSCTREWHSVHREGEVYESAKCEQNCMILQYIERCSCWPVYAAGNNSNVCSFAQMIRCKPQGMAMMNCPCPIECDRTIFEYDPPTLLKINDNEISTLHITFSRKLLVDTQLKRIKAVDLLSYVAGSMGLFLGMSCVTLLEVFIYLFKSIWGAFNDERHKYYFDNILGENEADDADEKRSYEQIVITTKVRGSIRPDDEYLQDKSGTIIEENYAVTTDCHTKRTSIYRMGPRASMISMDARSRSNTDNTSITTDVNIGDLRIQLAVPNKRRRRSVYAIERV